MKNHLLMAVAFVWILSAGFAQRSGYDTGMPFGLIGPDDIDRLEAYAKESGVDLMGDAHRAYQKDDEALARVFAFSLKFSKLDRGARTYGQIVYSSFLNLSEANGLERFSRIVAAQPKPVQQRVRDFIYFDATNAPKKIRKQVEADARKSAPILFPSHYVFGENDVLFQR